MKLIAEIGINFNGDMKMARELIRQAKKCDADVAKFQLYDAAKLFGADNKQAMAELSYEARTLTFEQTKQLHQWCQEEKIEFMASVFDHERLEWLEQLKVQRHKIASRTVKMDPDLCNAVLKKGKETFVSLGMWDQPQVPFKDSNAKYLYCVSKYPSELNDIHLPKWFPDSPFVGFSDHTRGIESLCVAVARGATVFEKHFTLDKNLPGPDHICSANPEELKQFVIIGRQISKFIEIERANK